MADAAAKPAGRKLSRWLISGPPLLYLLLFFAIPTLIMMVAAFRSPGDYAVWRHCSMKPARWI
jgi:spermidine/putrescine transport system permease protein